MLWISIGYLTFKRRLKC